MTERELAKGAAYHLAILRHAEEVTGNVAKTCQYYGIAPATYYKWLKRYETEGPDGPVPGHQVRIDVKFVAPMGGKKRKFYQFTAIDDCTRLRVLRIYDRLDQAGHPIRRLRPRKAPLPSRADPNG